MVMHARKQSKLNDGYADTNDSNPHQDMQYNRNLFTSNNKDYEQHHLSDHMSPRYQNKLSYIERNEEKLSFLSFAEKKVSRYLATGSLGRPVCLDNVTFTGEHLSASVIPDTPPPSILSGQRNERSGNQDDKAFGDYNNQPGLRSDCGRSANSSSNLNHSVIHNNKNSSHLYPAKGGNNNSHSEKDNRTLSNLGSTNGKQTTSKDKEIQKSAIRVCGDWSEHISSSGKRYYYNCKTEVSQWEKPKEWIHEMCRTLDHRSKDGPPRLLTQSHANKPTPEGRISRHSTEHQQNERARSNCINNGDTKLESQHGRSISTSNTHHYKRDSWQSEHLSGDSSQDISKRNINDLQNPQVERTLSMNTNSNPHYQHHQVAPHHTVSTCGSNGLSNSQPSDNKHNRHHSQRESQRYGGEAQRRRRTDSQGSKKYDIGHVPEDDMEISPSLSPSSSSHPSSTASTPQLPPTSTPSYNSSSNHVGSQLTSSPLGNPIPTLVNHQTVNGGGGDHNRTIQTLQELQKVLSMHIKAQQNTASSRPSVTHPPGKQPVSSSPATTSQHFTYPTCQTSTVISRSPVSVVWGPAVTEQVSGTQKDDVTGRRLSPMSDTSTRSSCGSQSPSDPNSQNATVNSQAPSSVALKREETAKLTASLCNYYNETLIGHVLGWQADVVEKQAAKLWEESMIVGSEQYNKISVELKRARSNVRIAEIQSMLHEQRALQDIRAAHLPARPDKCNTLYGTAEQLADATKWHWVEGQRPMGSWINNNNNSMYF